MFAKTRMAPARLVVRRGSFAVNTIGEVTRTFVAPLAAVEMGLPPPSFTDTVTLATVGALVSGVGEALVVKDVTTAAIVLPDESRSGPICRV